MNSLVQAVKAAHADRLIDAACVLTSIGAMLVGDDEEDRLVLTLYLLDVIDQLTPGLRKARWH